MISIGHRLAPEEDAYGQEMWAAFNGEWALEIVERDDGLITYSRLPEHYFSDYIDWPKHEKKALEYVKGRVLDIGCGAGRHSLYLQDKGLDVLAIDNSSLAIKICGLRGVKNALVSSIEEVSPDMGIFDTILMMGNNFGLFGSFEKARILLGRFYELTSSDALIIAETRDPYKTSNPNHLEYQEFNQKRGRMSGQLRIRIRFKKYTTPWFDYLLVSKDELEEILHGTGWCVNQYIDSERSNYFALVEKEFR